MGEIISFLLFFIGGEEYFHRCDGTFLGECIFPVVSVDHEVEYEIVMCLNSCIVLTS